MPVVASGFAMGNIHVFNHRFPALAASLFSSMSLIFLWIAGTSCYFLNVNANPGRFIENTNASYQEGVTSASFGVFCDSDYFSREGDSMWKTSEAFLYVSLVVGSMTTALAWILTYGIPPTDRTWKTLSIMSALTAVLNIPIFLLLESEPCTIDLTRQQCSLSFASYILMAGAVCSIVVTILTQSVDPPRWGIELDAWKVCRRNNEVSTERMSLSRDIVMSDEYDDLEDPEPADAPVATTIGVLELVQCWNERRNRVRSSDLKQGEAFGTSGIDEEDANMPLAGAGSYYADSNDSRLVLKVTPDGRLLGDDRKSLASFGDLDDYLKMVEEEQELGSAISTTSPCGDLDEDVKKTEEEQELSSAISTTSLDDFLDNAPVPEGSQRLDNILDVSPDDPVHDNDTSLDDFLDNASVPEGSQRWGSILVVSPDDPVHNNDGLEQFPDEPLFFSEMKPPSSTDYNKSLLDNEDNGSSDEKSDPGPENKLSLGIRSLTKRVRESSRRVKKLGRQYAMMEDDEESTGAYSIPAARDGAKDDESRGMTPSSDLDHLHHQKLLYDWNALHAAASRGILLTNDFASDSSDEEDEPESPYFTPNDTTGEEISTSSKGHMPDGEGDDSTYSDSSLSDVSNDKEVDRGFIGEGVVPISRSPRKDKARRSRQSRRKESSVDSVSSHTSVLDLIIDEETDIELREFESEDELMNKVLSSGYKSAPETLGAGDRGMSPYEFIQSQTLPANAERGYIVPRTKVLDSSLASDSSQLSEDLHIASVSRAASVTPEKVEYRSGKLSSDIRTFGYVPSADSEDKNLRPRRCRSMSIPRRRKKSSIHPLVTPPKSSLWREERLYKGGIHSLAVHIVSDDENSDECCKSQASASSVKSSISRRARKARIRRLQRELENATTNRKRSRTLDPLKKRRETKESLCGRPPRKEYRCEKHREAKEIFCNLPPKTEYGYDLPERNNPTLNRVHFGSDHGPDEASL